MTLYTLRCAVNGDSQQVLCCDRHAKAMPLVDGELVTAAPADADAPCEFCPAKQLVAVLEGWLADAVRNRQVVTAEMTRETRAVTVPDSMYDEHQLTGERTLTVRIAPLPMVTLDARFFEELAKREKAPRDTGRLRGGDRE